MRKQKLFAAFIVMMFILTAIELTAQAQPGAENPTTIKRYWGEKAPDHSNSSVWENRPCNPKGELGSESPGGYTPCICVFCVNDQGKTVEKDRDLRSVYCPDAT
jgi:hypothetical protein